MAERQEDSVLELEQVDIDGAIRETMDAAGGHTRAGLLAKFGLAGAGLVGGSALVGLLAPGASAVTLSNGDVAILNFALTLEYLEASFYTRADDAGALSGELARFASVVGAHERAHVAALKKVLGRRAVKKPRFDFHGTTASSGRFAATAQTLEDLGVAAYKGQAAKIRSNAILEAALAIHAVEARHAAWIRDINGARPAPAAFDQPKTRGQVLAAVAATRFIRRAAASPRPRFTG